MIDRSFVPPCISSATTGPSHQPTNPYHTLCSVENQTVRFYLFEARFTLRSRKRTNERRNEPFDPESELTVARTNERTNQRLYCVALRCAVLRCDTVLAPSMPSSYVPPHLRNRGGSGTGTSSAAGGGRNRSVDNGTVNNGNGAFNGNGNGNSNSSHNCNNSGRWKNLNSDNSSSSSNYNNNYNYNDRYNRSNYNNNYSSNNNRHHRDYDYDYDSRNSNRNRNPNPNPRAASSNNSRWANVDRASIESGGAKTGANNHRRGRTITANTHTNNNTRSHHTNTRDVEALFFGDSFIKLFALLSDYSDSVLKTSRRIEVHKYKAASAKGLCREGNENQNDIRARIEKLTTTTCTSTTNNNSTNNNCYPNLERLVFCFGSVDVHMSYYYKKFVQKAPLSNRDLQEIAANFVDFVAGLDVHANSNSNNKTLKKILVGIYPSPLLDQHVGASLKAYGSLETQGQVKAVDASEDRKMLVRQARVQLFNDTLKERCRYHNEKHQQERDGATASATGGATATGGWAVLEYYDVQDELLTMSTTMPTTTAEQHDTSTTSTTQLVAVKDAYRDVSDLNIHLIHETTLQLWVQKWPWYKALTLPTTTTCNRNANDNDSSNNDNDNNNDTFLEYLQKTFDEYRKTKPWAERTHVAETMGVQVS